MLAFIYLLLATQLHHVSPIPSAYLQQLDSAVKASLATSPAKNLPLLANPPKPARQKKGPSIPLQHLPVTHQILNLHVIPIQHTIHTDLNHIISEKMTLIPQNVHGQSNLTHPLVLIPFHNLVPVHDLTVIPLHRVDKIRYSHEEPFGIEERYRNPLGGYGAGWRFGGHGAGHGFHYAYG